MNEYLNIIYELAIKAFNNDDIPVGAIVVKNGKIIGIGYNDRQITKKVCSHAEINAIESACSFIGDWRLDGCVLYTTLFPCTMCYGAIKECRIDKVYYLVDKTNNNYEHLYDKSIEKIYNDEIYNKYVNLLATFFKNKRI